MKKSTIKKSIGYTIFSDVNYALLTMAGALTLIPVLYVILMSIRPEIDVLKYGATFFPQHFSLDAFKEIFSGVKIFNAFKVTVFITLVGTTLSLVVTAMMAYPLSKQYLPYNRTISLFVYIPMLFSGGLIPLYLVIRSLGILNSVWALILPALVGPWNMILMRNFFADIPGEIEESARIDGAGEVKVLFTIILPLSLPVIATISLFYAVGYWNEWFMALVFINDKTKWTLQVLLREILMVGATQELQQAAMNNNYLPPSETLKMALVVTATVPIMCIYPFLQKYFASGLTVGAVKG